MASNVSYWRCVENEKSPIVPLGHPIANTQIYLLDTWLQLVPIGVIGELYIGGVGLSRGYLRRADLTRKKFVRDPFSTRESDRLYRTGDLARYRADGSIEYIGRTDHQVKIRGFRVEPGEVEVTLRRYHAIKDAVITASADTFGQKQLVAYVVPKLSAHLTVNELRSFLSKHLPEYLIPTIFIFLKMLPLTQNGKIDRNALPAPDGTRSELQGTFVPPRDFLELELAQLWEHLLNIRPIGMTDNFFALGGHSLAAVRLIAQIKQKFQRDIPLATLFLEREATIENIASSLRQQISPASRSPLVKLQPVGTRRKLFFVHPVGGTVFCYLDLAHTLGPEQPFCGLQARGIDDGELPRTSIEDMATQYILALQTVQPEGPYLLGGWSLGGCIAFEMAQQLQGQHQEVALLALVDSWSPNYFTASKQDDDAALLIRFVEDLGAMSARDIHVTADELRLLVPDEQLRRVLGQVQLVNTFTPDREIAYMRQLFRVFKAHTFAIRHYISQPYPGRITLFRASERIESMISDETLGWQSLTSVGVDVHLLPGNHYTIVRKPHVDALVQVLRQHLNEMEAI